MVQKWGGGVGEADCVKEYLNDAITTPVQISPFCPVVNSNVCSTRRESVVFDPKAYWF